MVTREMAAGILPGHEKRRNPSLQPGVDHQPVRQRRVGDIAFFTGEPESARAGLRPAVHGLDLGTTARFGDGVSTQPVAPDQRRQQAFPLGVAAVAQQWKHRAPQMRVEHQQQARIMAVQTQPPVRRAELRKPVAPPAPTLRQAVAQQAGCGKLLETGQNGDGIRRNGGRLRVVSHVSWVLLGHGNLVALLKNKGQPRSGETGTFFMPPRRTRAGRSAAGWRESAVRRRTARRPDRPSSHRRTR